MFADIEKMSIHEVMGELSGMGHVPDDVPFKNHIFERLPSDKDMNANVKEEGKVELLDTLKTELRGQDENLEEDGPKTKPKPRSIFVQQMMDKKIARPK